MTETSQVTQLRELLGLSGVKLGDLSFEQFLLDLKDHPENADTAAALLIRAIESRGQVEVDDAPPERRPYLRMLAKMRVSSWRAFDQVKGSQRTVAQLMNHLHNAAANGHQLRLALIFKGGPASGKGSLAEAIKDCLEGEVVYAVKGCPIHENPINLLTLLPKERIDQLAQALDMTVEQAAKAGKPSLKDLIATAGKPCQHCWKQAMGGDEAKTDPNLGDVQIEAVRMSSRNFGAATWSGQEPLLTVLERGSRGIVDMPELFSLGGGPLGASNPELDVLLEATNDRRIPATAGGEISIPGLPIKLPGKDGASKSEGSWLPLDAILLGQTNDGAWDQFIKGQPDPNKFTRRMAILNVPYITSVSEEEAAYRDFIDAMRAQPHFDPMALKLAALCAVISRMQKTHVVDVVTRARMYDGEQLRVSKAPDPNSDTNEKRFWHVGEFWQEAGEDEGMYGLNMSDMLGAISQITEAALESKHGSVSAITMINFMRAKVDAWKKTPGLTAKQKEVLETVEEYLKGPKDYNDKSVGLVEAEYRRVLVRQLFEVASPDFERRASEMFDKYRRHAKAYSTGAKDLQESGMQAGVPTQRRVPVDIEFLDELDRWMGLTKATERDNFRRSIETRIGLMIQQSCEEAEEGLQPENVEINWETIQEIADGIRKKLKSETAKVLEDLLKSEIELDEEQKKLRRETLERFDTLGYNDYTREQALTYFRDYKLWQQS